ncbi:MAG: MFS transporter [Candidatus Caenarcaniphilales bacterium]|nr:MFS transporter [Candidatus Caenarcaniphilales bacterium]
MFLSFRIISASFLIFLALGGIYGWSFFIPALQNKYLLSSTQTQSIFGATIAVYSLIMILVGRFFMRLGTVKLGIISGLLFMAGYALASFSQGEFWLLFTGISILVGTGISFGYVSTLSHCVRSFPDKQGLVSGIILSGFGGGAILLSLIVEPLLSRGTDVLEVFRVIALTNGGLILISSLMLFKSKSQDEIAQTESQVEFRNLQDAASSQFDANSLWRDKRFWGLFIGMLTGCFAGFVVIGVLKPLGLSIGLKNILASLVVSIVSLGNISGRLVWGAAADWAQKQGWGIWQITLSLGLMALLLLLLSFALNSSTSQNAAFFLGLSALIGFVYGSNFVIYLNRAGHYYGFKCVEIVYPLILVAQAFSALIGPLISGVLIDFTGNYFASIVFASLIALLGSFLSTYLLTQGVLAHRSAIPSKDAYPFIRHI